MLEGVLGLLGSAAGAALIKAAITAAGGVLLQWISQQQREQEASELGRVRAERDQLQEALDAQQRMDDVPQVLDVIARLNAGTA